MRVKFRARKVIRLWPFYINLTQSANPVVALLTLAFTSGRRRMFSSWGVRVGPFTHNFTTEKTTVDTPGPGSFQFGGRRTR